MCAEQNTEFSELVERYRITDDGNSDRPISQLVTVVHKPDGAVLQGDWLRDKADRHNVRTQSFLEVGGCSHQIGEFFKNTKLKKKIIEKSFGRYFW